MNKLDLESRMTIKTLLSKWVGASEVVRLLGVSEGAVRYHVRRMQSGAVNGRAAQPMKAESGTAPSMGGPRAIRRATD